MISLWGGLRELWWEGNGLQRIKVSCSCGRDEGANGIDGGNRTKGFNIASLYAWVGEDGCAVQKLGTGSAYNPYAILTGGLVQFDEDGIAITIEKVKRIDLYGLNELAVSSVYLQRVFVNADTKAVDTCRRDEIERKPFGVWCTNNFLGALGGSAHIEDFGWESGQISGGTSQSF